MKQFILPAVVILIGAGSAFATQVAKKNDRKLAPRQGYIYNFVTNRCDTKIMCSTDPGPVCTVDGLPTGQQAFGTLGSDVEHPETCDVVLSKVQ